MQGLAPPPVSHSIGPFDAVVGRDHPGACDLGELEQPIGFHLDDVRMHVTNNENLFTSLRGVTWEKEPCADSVFSPDCEGSTINPRPALNIIPSVAVRCGELSKASGITVPSVNGLRSHQYLSQRGTQLQFDSPASQRLDAWGDSVMAKSSPRTDNSTDGDTDCKESQKLEIGRNGSQEASDSAERSKDKIGDHKTLRRLAQNREAARKSRMRKKQYVQQLENSRLKLTQLEQELQHARQQGIFIAGGYSGDQSHSMSGNGALAFDMEYARWLDEHHRQNNDLRSAVNSHAGDNELRILVDGVMAHYEEIFRLKGIAAKSDVFHLVSGMWKTPAERCFMWMGGFRPSELLKILIPYLEPLTEQQLVGICNLQQSSQQAEDALSQGMEALQQSLAETLASGSLGSPGPSGNVANYMGQMAMAMGKLGTLENFVHQADNLRQQTLQQMHRILTTRQAARGLLAISDYFSRLRALSSLWLARPKE